MTHAPTANEAALLAAVFAEPGNDLHRLALADELDDNARNVECPRCNGRSEVADPSTHIYGYSIEYVPCDVCSGTGTVPDGRRERAKLIRDGCADPKWHVYPEGQDAVVEVLSDERTVRLTLGKGVPGISLVTHKGFVGGVRGPLAAFWGDRECAACNGTGNVSGMDPPARHDAQCPAPCERGRVSGPTPVLVELVRANPVERIELTDVRPYSYGVDRRWSWSLMGYRDPRDRLRNTLPAELWDRIPGFPGAYPTESAATAAVSRALIAAARQ
jgi:uncharacterized protein (TIGR02996 family)